VKRYPILIAAVLLGIFAIIGTGLVVATHHFTDARIAENERQALLRKLHAIVPADSINNDIATDTITAHAPDLLGVDGTPIYRGRHDGKPVAVVLEAVVPDGYSAPIKMLVAVRHDGTLGGVRVVSHKETPGLGDRIDETKSDWILGFTGKSLGNPPIDKWKVKRDGGVFDQFTGATITPRSVVKAVKNALIFARQQGDRLYEIPTGGELWPKGSKPQPVEKE